MSSNSIYSHYVYRITNLVENRHYYGIRSCKNRSPLEDLGVRYFSSATNKEFIKDQKQNPSYYKYKIIRTCNSRKDAIDLEILLHEKFDVGANDGTTAIHFKEFFPDATILPAAIRAKAIVSS
jgi:hypothetical protein